MTPLILLNLAKRFWFAIPIALLVIALLLTRSTNARHRAELDACKQKQEINLNSITTLTKSVEEQNSKIIALSDAGVARQKVAQAALAAAMEREKASRVTVDALKRSATLKRPENAPCTISPTLSGAPGL